MDDFSSSIGIQFLIAILGGIVGGAITYFVSIKIQQREQKLQSKKVARIFYNELVKIQDFLNDLKKNDIDRKSFRYAEVPVLEGEVNEYEIVYPYKKKLEELFCILDRYPFFNKKPETSLKIPFQIYESEIYTLENAGLIHDLNLIGRFLIAANECFSEFSDAEESEQYTKIQYFFNNIEKMSVIVEKILKENTLNKLQ
jgi:hypothetical protein